MSNTSDIINLIRDILLPIAVDVYKYAHPATVVIDFSPVNIIGTERIVLNSIPNNQSRAGTIKQNNDVININIFVPKLDDIPDSARIETLDGLVQDAIESFNNTTLRVGYYYLDAQPSQTFNENDKETLTNIRCEATYT